MRVTIYDAVVRRGGVAVPGHADAVWIDLPEAEADAAALEAGYIRVAGPVGDYYQPRRIMDTSKALGGGR